MDRVPNNTPNLFGGRDETGRSRDGRERVRGPRPSMWLVENPSSFHPLFLIRSRLQEQVTYDLKGPHVSTNFRLLDIRRNLQQLIRSIPQSVE